MLSDSASTIVTPWPQALGLGAANDANLTKAYGDQVRREFMAMGFRWQLGPMCDLGTEPRWARAMGLFGDDALHVSKHCAAQIEGMQGSATGNLKGGIAATMKHFPGAGPNEGGRDSHTAMGQYNLYPGGNFLYHQIPFKAAIGVGAAAVMPNYSILKAQYAYDPLQVGSAFSKELITDYLKTTLGFTGMVTSDWGTMSFAGNGVQALTAPERAALFIKAGSHQLGSDSYTIVQAAFDQGLVTEDELDGAAGKILEMSFKLGLFENPYVDATAAGTVIRSQANMQEAFDAQKKAIVILKNNDHGSADQCPFGRIFCFNTGARFLPISGAAAEDVTGDGVVKVYFDGEVDSIVSDPARPDQLEVFLDAYDYTSAAAGTSLAVQATATPDDADVAVLRIVSRKGSYFGLDAGVPLSFDGTFPGKDVDPQAGAAVKDAHKVIDLLRKRDGYRNAAGAAVAATNPKLKIVLVMHMERPGIVKPFVDGLATLDETTGVPGSYPLVSNPANLRAGQARRRGRPPGGVRRLRPGRPRRPLQPQRPGRLGLRHGPAAHRDPGQRRGRRGAARGPAGRQLRPDLQGRLGHDVLRSRHPGPAAGRSGGSRSMPGGPGTPGMERSRSRGPRSPSRSTLGGMTAGWAVQAPGME